MQQRRSSFEPEWERVLRLLMHLDHLWVRSFLGVNQCSTTSFNGVTQLYSSCQWCVQAVPEHLVSPGWEICSQCTAGTQQLVSVMKQKGRTQGKKQLPPVALKGSSHSCSSCRGHKRVEIFPRERHCQNISPPLLGQLLCGKIFLPQGHVLSSLCLEERKQFAHRYLGCFQAVPSSDAPVTNACALTPPPWVPIRFGTWVLWGWKQTCLQSGPS